MSDHDFALMVCELQDKFTLAYIGNEIGLSERQVSNIKKGDKPKGMAAIKLYLFHAKHRTQVQPDRTAVHGAEGENST